MMYSYMVQPILIEMAEDVSDLIEKMPEDQPYGRLEDALVSRLSASEQRKLSQLSSEIQLGDRKPSQPLRHMKQLLGGGKTDDTLDAKLRKVSIL
ncbi:hypothetical protein EG68_12470 [Paragonimus skrjabini miyazakii]|uniref:DUF7041 domain-containing protein n=1 Tax=Paragonimus skrjabini miyazakii TaxID=59628 RepID=A0A8S9YI14_9TREM|nr:hypothetical protein EG68_12470 [Paragonimus skrjabini miyazakii]